MHHDYHNISDRLPLYRESFVAAEAMYTSNSNKYRKEQRSMWDMTKRYSSGIATEATVA